MSTLKLYLPVLLTFAVLDVLWVGLLMKGFYDSELGEIARRQNGVMAPRWPAAILVYLLIPLGIVLFVRPAMGASPSCFQAAGWGAAYGFIGYGLYDLTNRATLERWSFKLTAVDIAWGSVICAFSAVAMAIAESRTTPSIPS